MDIDGNYLHHVSHAVESKGSWQIVIVTLLLLRWTSPVWHLDWHLHVLRVMFMLLYTLNHSTQFSEWHKSTQMPGWNPWIGTCSPSTIFQPALAVAWCVVLVDKFPGNNSEAINEEEREEREERRQKRWSSWNLCASWIKLLLWTNATDLNFQEWLTPYSTTFLRC